MKIIMHYNMLYLLGCGVLFILFSCKKARKNDSEIPTLISKADRFSAFIDNPLEFNPESKTDKRIYRNFHRSYVLLESKYYGQEPDSLLRYATEKDVIEILKNEVSNHIVFIRASTKKVKFSNGVNIGMPLHDFNLLFPLQIDENYVATYTHDEFYDVQFFFDKETKRLKEIIYMSIIN